MYKFTQGDTILRLEDGALIPADPLNRDYQKYLDWRAKGGTPEAPDPEPTPLLKINLGPDVPPSQGERLGDDVLALRKYLNLASPTGEQTVLALTLLIRVVLFILKYRLGF